MGRGGRGEGRRKGRGGEGREQGGKGRGGEGPRSDPPSQLSGSAYVSCACDMPYTSTLFVAGLEDLDSRRDLLSYIFFKSILL